MIVMCADGSLVESVKEKFPDVLLKSQVDRVIIKLVYRHFLLLMDNHTEDEWYISSNLKICRFDRLTMRLVSPYANSF
jgi:hypothetical protein